MPSIKYFSSRGGWLWANDVLFLRKVTPGLLRDGVFLYSSQASFSWPGVDLARLLRRACSRSFWIISFEFVKVCGIRSSTLGIKASLVSISAAILFLRSWHVYSNFVEKGVLKGSMAASPILSQINECLLPCILLLYIE